MLFKLKIRVFITDIQFASSVMLISSTWLELFLCHRVSRIIVCINTDLVLNIFIRNHTIYLLWNCKLGECKFLSPQERLTFNIFACINKLSIDLSQIIIDNLPSLIIQPSRMLTVIIALIAMVSTVIFLFRHLILGPKKHVQAWKLLKSGGLNKFQKISFIS